MLRRFNLRFRIILQLCLVFMLGFFVQSYLSTAFLHQSYVQKMQQEQFNRVSAIAETIDYKLKSTQQVLTSVARDLPVMQLGDADSLQLWLDERRELASVFDNGIFVFSSAGDLLVESPHKPDRRGRSYSFRPYYQETVRTGQPYISDAYISSQQHNHPAIMMTAPIFDEQGTLLAILGGGIDLLGENFLGGLSRQKLGEKGYFYVAALDRTLIVHPDPRRIMRQDVPLGANALFDRAMQGFEGCEQTVNSQGLAALTAFKQLSAKNWVLAGNYPMSEINAPLLQARRVLWMTIGVTFLVMLLFSMLSFRQMFRPLVLFAAHLEGLSAKQGEERLFRYAGTGEIGTLVNTFNRVLKDTDAAHQALDYAQQMAHLGSWSWDLASNQLSWSDEVFRIFGDKPKAYQPTYERFLERIYPEDRTVVEQLISEALARKQTYVIEYRVMQADGSLLHVRAQGEVHSDQQGAAIGMVGTIQDVSDVIRLQNQLRELATIDELTGVANRRQLFYLAERALRRAIRFGGSFSLLFYDLDHFKQVNDRYGHPAGDEVLQKISALIQTLLRETDTLARYGGEEFCVLLPETSIESAAVLAERIRQSVETAELTLKSGVSLPLTVSVGVAGYQREDTVPSLIERADRAVYLAKQRGRNQVCRG